MILARSRNNDSGANVISNNLRKFRKLLGDGKRSEWPCQGCNAVGTIHGEVHNDAWNKFYGK